MLSKGFAQRHAQGQSSGELIMNEKSSPPHSDIVCDTPPTRRSVFRLAIAGLLIGLVVTAGVLTVNIWLLGRLAEQQRLGSREHAFWVLCQPGHAAAERASSFLQLAAAGNKEWRSADLRELNLAGLKLPGADLQGALFHNANLAGANLAGAHITKGSFAQADLSGADLSEADLSEMQLYRTKLNQANLRRAKLRAAYLQEAQAEKADLMVADLSDADCLMANLTGAKLNGANLTGAKLEAAVLRGANLSLARLDGANLKDADFTNANWWRARGLTSEQIDLLKKKFAPAENAEPALKQDYEKWTGGKGR
jgi:uncharacterized protein YjbI with pentapeptide repeats